jgi:threonylcarbamoyladenosine tRNA methylthiotransferase MtaB
MSGCFSATADEAARASLPEIDHWMTNPDKELVPLLERLSGEAERHPPMSDYRADRLLGHKRTFLKIQDGCDCRCAYCIVPIARGGHRSVPVDEIVSRVAASERDGAIEFLLTGIHIGRYGSERGGEDGLAKLVRRLLDETSRPRFRLGSIEPLELTPSLLSVFGETDRLCPHLHIPLQSGSDPVLRRMRRPYDAAAFIDAVAGVRRAVPDSRIGADVLVGFPGESDADFAATAGVIEAAGIDYLHVFPYSARPGTESAAWRDDIPPALKKERAASLTALGLRLHARFLEALAGRTLDVIVQRSHPVDATVSGISEFGVDARFAGNADLIGRMARIRIDSLSEGHLSGRMEGSLA